MEWLARKNYEARMSKVLEAAQRARRAAEIREELKTHDNEILAASIARWPVNVPISAQGGAGYQTRSRYCPPCSWMLAGQACSYKA